MRNLKFLFSLLILAMFLTSCQDVPGFQEGGWLPIVLMIVGLIIFGYKGVKSYNSPVVNDAGRTVDGKELPIGWIVLFLGTLAGLIWYIVDNVSNK